MEPLWNPYGTLMEPLWNHWNMIIWGGGTVERNSWNSLEFHIGIIAVDGQKCQISTGIHGFHAESQHSYDKIEQEAVSFIAPRNNAGLSIYFIAILYIYPLVNILT